MNDNSNKVIEVDINEILPNRFQPRIKFDEDEILELSDSIKEHGVIQPIIVRTIGDKYEIIAGERRYKASVLAGKETVPVIIKNLNDKDSAEIALIENIQRKNLTPIEEALSYKKILDMGYLTQEALAVKLGKSQSAVANKVRLLNLTDEVQEALLENKISERHARSLLRLKTTIDQNKMLEKITTERLTVRKTDDEIDKLLDNKTNEKEEEGEEIMNNEMNQIPNIITPNPSNNFDIFGGVYQSEPVPSVEIPTAPVVAPVPSVEIPVAPIVAPAPSVEIPTAPIVAPVPSVEIPTAPIVAPVPSVEIPTAPVVEPVPSVEIPVAPIVAPAPSVEIPTAPIVAPAPSVEMPAVENPGIQFDANGNVISLSTEIPTMDVPVISPIMEVPSLQPSVEMPAVENPGIQFDENGNVISISNQTPTQGIEVPVTSPIMEAPVVQPSVQSPVEILPTIDSVTPMIESTVIPEEVSNIPEPIIITDYNKQYDPIIPNQVVENNMKVDFKEIINAIRECSAKIEQYGYKIDVEEYDLSSIYQVVFKVEK